MTEPLEVICANKVRIMKKVITEPNEEKCTRCSGYNDTCKDYYPMVTATGVYKQ